jgi:hypothetical protein
MKCDNVNELHLNSTSYKLYDHGNKNKIIDGHKPDKIKVIPKYRNPENIHAVDTETINNTCRLFLYSENSLTNEPVNIKHEYTENFLDFYNIFLNKLDKRNIYFFYNLNYDVNAIIRLLFNLIPENETIRQLCQYLNQGYRVIINPKLNKKTGKDKTFNESFHLFIPEFPYSNVKIHYIKRKFFWISDGRKSIKFFDIMQFYQQKGLDNACLLNLNFCPKCGKNLGKEINEIEKQEYEQSIKEKRKPNHFKEYENTCFYSCKKCNTIKAVIKIKRKTYVENPDDFYDNEEILYKDFFIKYAENDVLVTKKLCEHLYDIFHDMENDSCGLIVEKPISQAKVAKIAYRKHNNFTENILSMPMKWGINKSHMPDKIRKRFTQALINEFKGGLFMTLKKGTFRRENGNGVFLSDINSAYPAIQCNLRSIMNLEVDERIGEPNDYMLNNFDNGVLKVKIRQNNEYFNIFPVHLQNGAVTYPNTKNEYFQSYIKLSDYLKYKDMEDIDIIVKSGFYYHYNSDYKPYNYLKDDYIFRQKLKKAGNPAEHGVKIKINATFGATIQANEKNILIPYNAFEVQKNLKLKPVRIYDQYFLEKFSHYEAGIMYNILNGGEITGQTQNIIKAPFIDFNNDNTAKCFNDNINYLVQLATDSILTTKKLKLNYGDNLGEWKLEKENKSAIVGGNGIISIGEKESDGDDEINKFRGFQTKTDIKQLLRDNADKSIIELPTTQLIGYTTTKPRVDFNRINKAHLKKINLNQIDYKRIWNKKNVKASDLLNNIYTSKSAILGDYKIPYEYVPLNTARKPDYKHLTSLHEQLAKDKPNTRQQLNKDLYDPHNIDSSLTRAEQQTERRRQTEKTFKEYFEH